jgi:hypothetical protein
MGVGAKSSTIALIIFLTFVIVNSNGAFLFKDASAQNQNQVLMSGSPGQTTRDSLTEFSTDSGMTWNPAFIISPIHTLYGVIPTTRWIGPTTSGSTTSGETDIWYRTTFQLPECFNNPSLNIQINADNWAAVYLNSPPPTALTTPAQYSMANGIFKLGEQPRALPSGVKNVEANFDKSPPDVYSTANPALFNPGPNTIYFMVHDYGNPTGLDYLASVTHSTTLCPNGTFNYSSKFVCVPEVGPVGGALVPQNYSTAVNVHNPHSSNITFLKKAVIAQSEDERRGIISEFVQDRLEPDEALSIDCTDIVGLFNMTTMTSPSTVGDGFVVLNSNHTLDVSAVYTTRDSIDVENIQPTTMNDTDDTNMQLPDLTIRLPERTSVRCSSLGGFCTHIVPVQIINLASTPVINPFQVRVSADNGMSRTLDVPSLSGNGVTTALANLAPPGQRFSCYDPDCRVEGTVDSSSVIAESNEMNNRAARTDTR